MAAESQVNIVITIYALNTLL